MLGQVTNSQVSAIKMLNAVNAFRNTAAAEKTAPAKNTEPQVSEGIEINDNSLLKTQNVDEIKKYAEMAGENQLSDDDIKYGLSYGRSVIVEYLA